MTQSSDNQASGATQGIIDLWKTRESADWAYFEAAESDDWNEQFWGEGSLFARTFDRLDLSVTLELACGAARHSSKCIDRIGQLYLADTSIDALAEAKQRFADRPNVTVLPPGDGMTIPLEGEAALTSLFSYDAMVHFELDCIASYLRETARLLRPGGLALLHHSIYDANPGGEIDDNPGWRNFMSQDLFNHFARRAELEVVEQHPLDWPAPSSDCLSLLRKPS